MSIPQSAAEKFNHAQGHFSRLKSLSTEFFQEKPYRIRTEPNLALTEYRFYVDFQHPLPSIEWGLILGDGLQCLRSALDHAVYGIGVRESGIDPPPEWRSLEFPITKDADHWNRVKWHIRSLTHEAQAAFAELQPHGDSTDFLMTPLGGLQELNNADKHRAIRAVAVVPVVGESLLTGLVPGAKCKIEHRVGPLEADTPLMTLTCAVPSPKVRLTGALTIEIGVPWVRGNGEETTIVIWPNIDSMNSAVTMALNTLASFA